MIRRASIKLIVAAVSEKWTRQLAFYHLLKYHFNNSCIYDYRSRMKEIAAILNVSEKTLYNYFRDLRSKELICDHASNLKVVSIRELRSWKRTTIDIESDHNLFDITCLLYAKLIERKVNHQAFAESVRRMGRGDRYKNGLCESPFRPSLSYRTIAKLLNISKNKAVTVVKNLNRLGIIKTTRQKPELLSEHFTDLKSVEDFPGYRFILNQCLFEVFGNRIELVQFPAYLKRITVNRYVRQYKALRNSDL